MSKLIQSKDRNYTIFGAETEFSGELTSSEHLLITGTFNGTINSSGNVEISKEAICTVNTITANSVVVSGRLKGDIFANDFVEMKNGSSVVGNVNVAKLRIEDGVDFQGKVSMIESVGENDLFAMTPSEYKDSLEIYRGVDIK